VKLDRLFLSLALVLAPALAQAQDGGFYLGGALGQSKFKDWCDTGGSSITLPSCKDSDTAWKFLGGYRFNRYVAAEASYLDWGEVTASTSTGVQVAAKQRSYGLAAVGTLPLGERFELFGKAGFLMTQQETRRITPNPSTVDRDETELHYGLGARYAFTRNWAARAEWENTDKLKVEMLSLGVEYRF
jgi:opacity protein-like surface antigen